MFLWLHTMALGRHTQHKVTGLRGTWQKLQHTPAGLRAHSTRAALGLEGGVILCATARTCPALREGPGSPLRALGKLEALGIFLTCLK